MGKKKDTSRIKFWESYYRQHKKEFKILSPKLRVFLKEEGFRFYRGNAIRIKSNIAEIVQAEDIFKHCNKYVESFNNASLESAFIKQGEILLIKNKALLLTLTESEYSQLEDNKLKSYKYFKNGIVVIEKNKKLQKVPYHKAEGFIWKEWIINRSFKIYNNDTNESSMFSEFLKLITNDKAHFISLCSAIGYLLHIYKDPSNPKCIIINDDNTIDDGRPKGGSGKGLIVKAISKIVQKAMFNGKNSNFADNKFAYQNINELTNIIQIDDVNKNFNLESLFSVITDDMPVEKKHQPIIIIPFKRSPKFIITTNYTIRGDSSSFKRRRFDIFLNDFFNDANSPLDEFNCEFFTDWDKKEWKRFDFFMVSCIRLFLSRGLIEYNNETSRLKMLKNETSPDFWELMENRFNKTGKKYLKLTLRNALIDEYGDKYEFLNSHYAILKLWLSRYAEYKGLELIEDRTNSSTYFVFKAK